MAGKTENKILNTVRRTIAAHRMFAAADRVLMAVSGGPDSVTLAHVLHSLAAEYGLKLAMAHLNHGLRQADSDHDAEFVAALARRLQVPLYAQKKDLAAWQGGRRFSPEEAARRMRYEFLESAAGKSGCNKIALGHQADDNAELVLMNLLRGSGPLGLAGIAAVRDNRIVRPLLGLRRAEIESYLAEKKLTWVVDASNSDLRFLRNRIRHELIPELQRCYNPKITATLNRLGNILQAENQWLEQTLQPVFERCVRHRQAGQINLCLSRLGREATAVRRRIIRRAIMGAHGDLRRVSLFHIDAVLRLAEKGPDAGRLDLPAGIRVQRKREELIIMSGSAGGINVDDRQPGAGHYQYEMGPDESLVIPEAGVMITTREIKPRQLPPFESSVRHLAFFDMERLQFPLTVRNVRPGDRFSPLGVAGSQKVKKYFNDHRVPPDQRQNHPLVLSRDQIIWLAGQRIANWAKVRPDTRRILRAEFSFSKRQR